MKILLVTDSYPPEIRSASHLMKELAQELCDRRHDVTVLTCQPKYNLADGKSFNNLDNVVQEEGVRVIRVHTPAHHKVNFFVRGLSQLVLPYLFWFKAKPLLKGKIDSVIVYSPPLTLWRVGLFAKNKFKAKFILNVQDIFPQNAIDLGVLTNPLIIGFFERLEKAAYDNADVVTVHSEGNRDFLLKNGKVSDSKLITLHNWINVTNYEFPEHDGPFRRKLGLAGKFVIFFGGVLGPSQGLDMVIEAARQLVAHSEIVFLFVGDGTEKNRLMELASKYGLKNVIFHPFISKEDYERTLREIDVGLVCLSSKNRTPVVPGKILSYMASGVPVLAFLNEQSDGHQIVKDANCGYSAISSDLTELVRLVQKIYEQREHLDELGRNGYHYAVSNFSKESCVNELEKALML